MLILGLKRLNEIVGTRQGVLDVVCHNVGKNVARILVFFYTYCMLFCSQFLFISILGCLVAGCPVGHQFSGVYVWSHFGNRILFSELSARVLFVPVYH